MKSLFTFFLLFFAFIGNTATLRTVQFDPSTSNSVPTNINIRANSLNLGSSSDLVPILQILYGTNDIGYVTRAISSNSVSVTNITGLLHKASAATIILDCNDGNNFQITNQLAQDTTLVLTNLAQGQEICISGEVDGTSRTLTIVPHLGFLVRDFDNFGVAAAANKAITVTNNNSFEVSIKAKWGFGTNFSDIITRLSTSL